MLFRQLFDPESSTYTYVLADPDTKEAVLIDPVREQLEQDLAVLDEMGVDFKYILDTHVHADHVTGAALLREKTGAQTVLSKRSGTRCADIYVDDGDVLTFGNLKLEVRATPGHTNGCVTYVTGDRKMAFTGDALLIEGTGRTDFQQGDARALYRSIQEKIYTLPDECVLYPAHDYKGRTHTTVAHEKAHNARIRPETTEEEFVATMASLSLPRPKKIDESLPANLECGRLPEDEGLARSAESGVVEVDGAWLKARLGKVRVVDVREPSEFAGGLGHIPGAENAPLATLQQAAAAWPKDQPVVLVCRAGRRSVTAAALLEKLGFSKVASLAGGMVHWSKARLPVERSAGSAQAAGASL